MSIGTQLVTGATDGIGKQIALALGKLRYRVLVHGRTRESAEAACASLRAGAPAATFEPVFADFASFAQVRALADDVRQRASELDGLVNNAGVFSHTRVLTEDGQERTMQVNYFSPFLLTHALLPALERAPQGRVVNVSSMAHAQGRIALEDLTFAKRFDGFTAYAVSKLANVLFTYALARRLTMTLVTVNAVHPGVIGTKLLRDGFGTRAGRSTTEGAKPVVRLAAEPALAAVTSRYYHESAQEASSDTSYDIALQEALYHVSAEITGVTSRVAETTTTRMRPAG